MSGSPERHAWRSFAQLSAEELYSLTSAVVTERWNGLRWTHLGRETSGIDAYGNVVWSLCLDAGIKPTEQSVDDGDKKARSPGRARSKP